MDIKRNWMVSCAASSFTFTSFFDAFVDPCCVRSGGGGAGYQYVGTSGSTVSGSFVVTAGQSLVGYSGGGGGGQFCTRRAAQGAEPAIRY
jgi:hypothetical protein